MARNVRMSNVLFGIIVDLPQICLCSPSISLLCRLLFKLFHISLQAKWINKKRPNCEWLLAFSSWHRHPMLVKCMIQFQQCPLGPNPQIPGKFPDVGTKRNGQMPERGWGQRREMSAPLMEVIQKKNAWKSYWVKNQILRLNTPNCVKKSQTTLADTFFWFIRGAFFHLAVGSNFAFASVLH